MSRRLGAFVASLIVALSAFVATPSLAATPTAVRATHAASRHEGARPHARHHRKRHHRRHHSHLRAHSKRLTFSFTIDRLPMRSGQVSAPLAAPSVGVQGGTGSTTRTTATGGSTRTGSTPTGSTTTTPTTGSTTGSTSDATSGASAPSTGAHWLSGATTGVGAAGQAAFGSWRGQATAVASTWGSRGTWDQIAHPDSLGAYTDYPGRLSLGIAMLPEQQAANFDDCAAGAYDAHFSDLGRTLVQAGRGDTFVRLGWEFNGDWYIWSAKNTSPATWVACWRHEVRALRATDPDAVVVWNGNQGSSWNTVRGHELSYWPGDTYVDVVGVDYYDMWPAETTQQAWDNHYGEREPDGAPYGLGAWLSFARSHGKKLAVPEWGVSTGDGGGGDNPFYVQQMFDFFTANAGSIAYECYFDAEAPFAISPVFGSTGAAKSAARYRSLF